MAKRCTSEQVAEALMIWAVDMDNNIVLVNDVEDIEEAKCLDLLISTLDVFRDAFDEKFDNSYVKHKEKISLSMQNFVAYLVPRCLLLSENNGCFDLMLTCAFVTRLIFSHSARKGCFHFAPVACKHLTLILENRFSELFETDSGWEKLMSYCRKVLSAVFSAKENRSTGYGTFSGLNEDSKENSEGLQLDPGDSAVKNETLQFDDNKRFEQKNSESSNEHESTLTAHAVSDSKDKLMDEGEPHVELSTTDAANWDSSTQPLEVTRKLLTNNSKHLKDVLNLIQKLELTLDAKCCSEIKFISESDENIETLLKEVDSSSDVQKVFLSDEIKEQLRNKICEKKNESLDANSSQNRVRPADVTDDEIYELYYDEYIGSIDEPKCEFCKGRKAKFINICLKRFAEKYANAHTVSDLM